MFVAIGISNRYCRKKKPSRYVIPPSFYKNSEKFNHTIEVSENSNSEKTTPLADANNKLPQTVKNLLSEPLEKFPDKPKANESTEEINFQKPKILVGRNAKKVSALSLKSIAKKHEMKQEFAHNQPEVGSLPVNNFTEESMLFVWNAYTKIIEGEGKFNLLSHLSMGIPRLEGTIIHLEFPNNTIKLEVERAKHELLNFLREKLQNYSISISIEVNEIAIKRYAYTSREKFEKLKERNPLVESLRKEFDLDI